MKIAQWPLALAAAAFAALVACGGGSAPGSEPSQPVVLSTYVTDDVSKDFAQVWVQVLSISAIDAAGRAVMLYEPSAVEAANPLNLTQLSQVAQLLSQTSVPPGEFRRVDVTLADAVTLVPRDGDAAISATLGGAGTPVTLSVPVVLRASESTALVLDFDLAHFAFDAGSRRITPSLVRREARELERLLRRQAELHATVISVGTDSFVVDDRHLGAAVTVQLAADAVVVDEADGSVTDLSELRAGTRIEARVVLLPKARPGDPTVAQAALVRIEPPADDASNARRYEGVGTVTAIETGTARTVLTVELHEATFMPAAASVKVDVTRAGFSHGTLADVAPGTRVEFRGFGSGAGVTASRVEVDGAASRRERSARPQARFVEGEGTVERVSGSRLVVTVSRGSHGLVPGRYAVDASRALFETGRLGCLQAGETIEVAGSLDVTTRPDPTLVARVIEIRGGCPAR